MTRHKSSEESEILSSYSLLLIDVSRLTTNEKDSTRCGNMRLWTLKPLLITSCSDTTFLTIREHPLEVTWRT